MKRGIMLFLIAALLLCSASCRKETRRGSTAAACAEEVMRAYGYEPSGYALRGREELLSGAGGQKTLFERLYRDAPPRLYADAIADYAAGFSRRDDGAELEIMRAGHFSEKERLRELFDRRLEMLRRGEVKNYLFDGYESRLSSAMIYEKGNYVCLIALGDNEKAIALLEKML